MIGPSHFSAFFARKLLTVGFLAFLCSGVAVAQAVSSDHCEVMTLDVSGKKLNEIKELPGKSLGKFETVRAEEELTTRVFRLPKTHLFVIASVWYTDESMASEKGADSISLELIISRRRQRDMINALHFSDSEMPLNGFDVGRVTTLAKTKHKTIFVIMECRVPSTK